MTPSQPMVSSVHSLRKSGVAFFLALLLLGLIGLVHYHLWLSSDGVRHVEDLQVQLQKQQGINDQARKRNEMVSAEVDDLRNGLELIQEYARTRLGMIGPDEIMVHLGPLDR